MNAKKKYLILGSGGQLGREWCAWLEKQGAKYRGLTRKELDITCLDALETLLDLQKPDVVVNCAAYTKVDQAEDEQQLAVQVNQRGPGLLARCCENSPEKPLLVHYSTDYVFPGRLADRSRWPDGYPIDAPAEPVNWYGETKWKGEEEVRAACANHLILRVSWLCGSHGNNFVHTMLRLAGERDHLKVVADQYGCPSFTEPVTRISSDLVDLEATGTFHISSKGETSWYDFAKAILRGRKVRIDPITTAEWPTRAARPAWSRLDITALADVSRTRILPWQEDLDLLLRQIS